MYPWQYWLDHVTDPSNVFTVVDNGDGTYTITPAGTVMQQGTPQDQAHFNNIEAGVLDAHMMASLLLNFARQMGWRVEDIEAYIAEHNVVETGTVTLHNSLSFPFNNSVQTVALTREQQSVNYVVITNIGAFDGNVGDIEVTDRLVNGFKVAYTGSAASATINYIVIGGFNE